MSKFYLGVMALSLLFVTTILSMEDQVADETEIPIAGENKPIKYGLLKYSETIKHLLEDTITTKEDLANLKANPIPVPNLTMANWNELIPLLENIHNNDLIALNNALKKKKLQHLIAITSGVWNYLDIQPLLNAAIIVIADKIKERKKLVCNAKSLKSLDLKVCPAGALVVSMPTGIEKMIAQKISMGSPIVTKTEWTGISKDAEKLPILGEGEDKRRFTFNNRDFVITFQGKPEREEKNEEGDSAIKPITLIISEIIGGTPKEIYRDTATNIHGDYEFSFSKWNVEIHKINDNPLSFVIGGILSSDYYNLYTISEPNTILEAQIYLKKKQGKKLNKDEQKIYDELMKK